jgi:LuxR family maltose regulon positive regulatory protein
MTIRATKLQPPVERMPWIKRPRLMEKLRLDEHAFLTVVCAPAGFGKTVVMAQWCRALAERGKPFAWVSLDLSDNDESVFVAHLEAALRPWVADRSALVQALQSSPVVALDAVMAELCRATSALSSPVTLFLDDLHCIDNPAVERFVEQLIVDGGLHLVIASRMVPSLSLGKLRMLGGVTEIGADDLRFDLEDANRFLAGKVGADPEPGLLVDMVEKTEGWAAGLQLASLQMAAGGTIAGFSGGGREVTEFLMQEVFGVLSEDIRDFLLKSALLERFSAESCRAILRCPDAEAMIAAIEARQLFIVRLDQDGHWFRYHQIFRDFLKRQLERQEPLAIAPLHLAAAEWYLEQGAAADAVRHTLLAGDDRRAAAIVERSALPMIADCRFREIEELLAQLPRRIVGERIRLQFAIIWISVHSSQARRATAALARAYALLEADPERGADRGTLPPASIDIELAVLDAAVASTCERFEEARDKAAATLRRLPVSAWFLQAVAYNIIGYNEYALGDIDAGRKSVLSALHAHHRSGSILGLVICNCYLAAIERSAGRLDLSRNYLQAAIGASREQLGPGSYGEALAQTMLMDIAYETGEIAEAEALAETVRPLIEGGVVVLLPIVSVPTYARLLQYRGRNEEALALLARVDAGEDRIYLRLAAVTMHERVRLLILMERVGEARSVLDHFRAQLPGELPAVLLDFVRLAEARILLAEKKPAAARSLLDELVPSLRAGGRSRRLVLALLLLARCGPEREMETLADALRIARAGGFQRLLVDEGAWLRKPLEALSLGAAKSNAATAEFAQQLLAALEPRAGAEEGGALVAGGLTSREAEVLIRLCTGASNRDLASGLQLSEPTVKWHLKNIFGKLGVSNRLQAVRKAQDYGLVK